MSTSFEESAPTSVLVCAMPVSNQTSVDINKYRGTVTALKLAIPLLFCEYTLDSSRLTLGDWLKAEAKSKEKNALRG
jgi:hypothetical protein